MTTLLKIDTTNPDPHTISQAAKVIRSGGLVAFPTETVYGLGADALNPESVRKIYEAKGRPSDNPLILHISAHEQAESLVLMNDTARLLARTFWPGPLTLVLPAKDCIPLTTRGGLDTAAIRMPDNPTALALITASHTPIAAPSANLSGRPSPTDAQGVLQDMDGRIAMILDGGSTRVGIESTVIDVTDPKRVLLLRPGGLARDKIEHLLSMTLAQPDSNSKKRSPGTRYRHYSPSIPVKLWNVESVFPDCRTESAGFIGLHQPPVNVRVKLLFGSMEAYAGALFAAFRQLEEEGCSEIIAEYPADPSGISEGIRDRLIRAAGD